MSKIPPAMWQDPEAFDDETAEETIEEDADHARADGHDDHDHGSACGHVAEEHGDHVDYVHDGHRHAPHGGHYDEH